MDGITIDVVEENGDEMIPDGDEDHKAIWINTALIPC